MIASQHHIICHIHIAYQTHTDTVLRHKGKTYAKLLDLHRIHFCQIFHVSVAVCKPDTSAFSRLQSCNSFQKFLLSASGNSGNTQDFSTVDRKIYIIQCFDAFFIFAGQPLNLQAFLRIYRIRTVDIQIHLGAYHHL